MAIQTRRAAQYIRMSTDRQDLSPLVQKEAIAAFADANGFDIVRSYEDEGRSGLQLANRPGLRQLLKDVGDAASFTEILVYDVSRWGRFQDADASAYYEYHCRMHGVQVIYVSESFANDQAPTTVLLKSMRRVMAAEYSRDIAFKARAGQQRVVSMGFHMGPLPALGYRRCSVAADGSRRVLLQHGQRKMALTDRVEWVLGPKAEVDLVRRICVAYASGFQLEEIAGLVNAAGWRTEKGRAMSTQGLKKLMTNEALIGNFVWGVKSKGGKVIKSVPTRKDGSVPRILDDTTWSAIQGRFKRASEEEMRRRERASSAVKLSPATRVPKQLSLPLGQTADRGYRGTLGSPQELREHTGEFGRALCDQLQSRGLPTAFDPRTNVLTFWSTRIRIRLMWPDSLTTWKLEWRRNRCPVFDTLLVARMTGLYRPLDFFLLPTRIVEEAFAQPMWKDVPRELRPFWCSPGDKMVDRLKAVGATKGA